MDAISQRQTQLRELTQNTRENCQELEFLDGVARMNCDSMTALFKKDMEQLSRLVDHIEFLGKSASVDKKRGLVDGIGGLAKCLFGVMDAEDEKLINEQLSDLSQTQETLRGAMRGQLQVLNKTVVHINNLEETMQYNEEIITNVTNRMGMALDTYGQREQLSEYFETVNAVVSDLLRDAEQLIEFLLHLKRGVVHPAVVSHEVVLTQLKEAVPRLPDRTRFPFKVTEGYWNLIEKFGDVVAYMKGAEIVVVMKFPLVTYPVNELIHVLPLPVHSHDNVYALASVKNSFISIDKEGKTYALLTLDELSHCKNFGHQYFCEQSIVEYYVNGESPCEVRTYLREEKGGCGLSYLVANQTLWLSTQSSFTWLYSTHTSEQITIRCKGRAEVVATVKKTGQVTLTADCKLLTQRMHIRTGGTSVGTQVQVYIPGYNLSLPTVTPTHVQNSTGVKLKPVLDGSELSQVSTEISKILEDVDTVRSAQGIHPHMVYSMVIGSISMIVVVIVVIVVWRYVNKWKVNVVYPSVSRADRVRTVQGQSAIP